MDGVFSKIVYSTEYFALNGIYVSVPITQKKLYESFRQDVKLTQDIDEYDHMGYKHYIHFDPYTLDNRRSTEMICRLEETILNMYSPTSPKKQMYSLKTQLLNGVIKIHTDTSSANHVSTHTDVSQYILKISGVWETGYSYGITYKFTEKV